MKPRLRIAVSTRTLPELRSRLLQVRQQGREGSLEEIELAEELYRRTGGCEGQDPALQPWLRLLDDI